MAMRNVQSLPGLWMGMLRRKQSQGWIHRQELAQSEKTRTDNGPSTQGQFDQLLENSWVLLYAQRKIF